MADKEYHARKSRESYERLMKDPERKARRYSLNKAKRQGRKAKYVALNGGKCAHCNQVFPDCVFEFHHVNHEEKEYQPSHLFLRSEKIIEEELSKCVMLCANCHRIEHHRLGYDAHEKRNK